MKNSIRKRLLFYLQHIDGIWSIPLAFFTFLIVGATLTYLFGPSVGQYDPGFIQPLFLASVVVIGATNVAVWGLFFTFRGLYRYLYGERIVDRNDDNKVKYVNYAKVNWLKLTPWQRYVVAFGVFFYYVSAIIIVYLQFV